MSGLLRSIGASGRRLLDLEWLRRGGENRPITLETTATEPRFPRPHVRPAASPGIVDAKRAEPQRAVAQQPAERHLVLVPLRSGFELRLPITWAKSAAGAILGRRTGGQRLHVEEGTVSRDHARLTLHTERPDHCLIEDLGSSNGTFVNRARLLPFAPTAIAPGDIIGFGTLEYLLAWSGGVATPSPQPAMLVLEGVHPETGMPMAIEVKPDSLAQRGFALIGRNGEHCDYRIDHATVSRLGHAKLLFLRGSNVAIADVGARNGVIVDGVRVPAEAYVPLREGAVVQLGAVHLRVVKLR
ncbi:MAG: FHA domain-containing protein [Hyphomicrobiaceae bacterium]|nr:FHA domain-containing protein [Hyphomicrobiaceae bacterium]